MILGAHQPHFAPWLGYFDKIRRSDLFVVVDHVQFERQNYQNRNRVLGRDGPQWLVVPVLQRSRAERIVDKRIDDKRDGRTTWSRRLCETLRHAYARAPFFEAYAPALFDLIDRPEQPWESLVELDLALIRWFMEVLEIQTPIVRSSELHGIHGAKNEMILSLCRAVGATTYLSGSGGSRAYLDVSLFERDGIRVEWQTFDHARYPQVGRDEFVSHLSTLDLVFHCGPASAAVLRGGEITAPAKIERTAA